MNEWMETPVLDSWKAVTPLHMQMQGQALSKPCPMFCSEGAGRRIKQRCKSTCPSNQKIRNWKNPSLQIIPKRLQPLLQVTQRALRSLPLAFESHSEFTNPMDMMVSEKLSLPFLEVYFHSPQGYRLFLWYLVVGRILAFIVWNIKYVIWMNLFYS